MTAIDVSSIGDKIGTLWWCQWYCAKWYFMVIGWRQLMSVGWSYFLKGQKPPCVWAAFALWIMITLTMMMMKILWIKDEFYDKDYNSVIIFPILKAVFFLNKLRIRIQIPNSLNALIPVYVWKLHRAQWLSAKCTKPEVKQAWRAKGWLKGPQLRGYGWMSLLTSSSHIFAQNNVLVYFACHHHH